MGAASGRTDKAHRMRIIDHYQRIELIRQIADSLQIGDHAIH
jgi:hypothetical protein